MEENKHKSKNKISFSIVLSFVVAVFGLFSILSFGLATYGKHGGVSYAAPLTADTFTLKSPFKVWDSDYNQYSVPLYYADDAGTIPVFCVEHAVPPGIDNVYNKQTDAIVDYGLLYLLNNTFANGVRVTDATGQNADYVEAWVTQTAIWVYLAEKYPDDANHAFTAAQLTDMKAARDLYLVDNAAGTDTSIYVNAESSTLYDRFVSSLVADAKAASAERSLSVTINSDTPASVAEDKSFYQSPIVTVVDNDGGLIDFDVTISGVNGAYLVDEAGNRINATGLSAGTKFYVRIPADKVGTETVNVTVNVKGHFDTLTGSYYVSSQGNEQKVVTVTGTTMDVSSGDTFQIIPTPDTGMNVTQTIYFIGLIVLLCGVGIVYANAKPVEIKQ